MSNLLETTDTCPCSLRQELLMPRERIRCQKEPDLKNKTEDANNKQIYERSSAIMSEYFQRKVVSFRLQEVLEMS